MKKKILLSFVLSVVTVVAFYSISARAGYYDKLVYTVSNGEVTITDCDESATAVEIPNMINGYPVTKIGRFAFDNCTNLESVIIPEGVIDIGDYAFNNCSALTEIAVPGSVVNVETGAFSNCYSIQRVDIADIEAWCYINFKNYQSNPMLYAYEVYINGKLATDIIISDAITQIKDYTFYGCDTLESVIIHNNITSIGECSFSNCYELKSIIIPSSVTSIGSGAFSGCSSLEIVTNNADITDIKNYTFSGCRNLKSITIPRGVTSIGVQAFTDCSSLTDIELPDTLTAIYDTAFWKCSSLTDITIPSSVTYIGSQAFRECIGLKRVNVTDIGAWCSINFVDTQSNPLSYAYELFFNEEPVTDIVVPEGVTYICDYAFYNCTTLKKVTISNSVQGIGLYAFFCPNLESVTMGNSINFIWNCAFFACSKLSTVIMPEAMILIGHSAFAYCTELNTIYYKGTESQWYEIQIESNNDQLINATIHFLGEEGQEPETPVWDVQLNMDELELEIGETQTLIATVFPDDATNQNLIWTSDDESIATVENGTVTAIGTGWTCITVETEDGSFVDYCNVYVIEPFIHVTGIELSTTVMRLLVGESFPIHAIITPEDATIKEIFWISSNESIATVEHGGDHVHVQGISAGEVIITAVTADGELTAECLIVVNERNQSSGGSGGGDSDNDEDDYENTNGDFIYTVSNDEATIIDYTGSAENIIIPDRLDGYLVTAISRRAFFMNDTIVSITIPNSITSIEEDVFSDCESLESINVAEENEVYSSKDGVLFNKRKTKLILYPVSKKDQTYIVPDSVTTICNNAFYACYNLTDVTIPGTVISIGDQAFCHCHGLENVTLKEGTKIIGPYAFDDCNSLVSITIPDSVTSIGEDAFSSCESLESITVGGKNEVYSSKDGVLFNKRKTKLILYPSQREVVTYEIPNSVVSIGKGAFSRCKSLVGITIPESVTNIEESAFYYCESLVNVIISGGVTSIKNDTFNSCISLESITIPDSITSIGDMAFFKCESLTNITIPDGVTSIGSFAFSHCTGLTSVIIPVGVSTINHAAFSYCENLKSITIPDSVMYIEVDVFDRCRSLESVTIPVSIISIDDSAFDSCTALTDVYYKGTTAQWEEISIGRRNTPLLNATMHFNGVVVKPGGGGNLGDAPSSMGTIFTHDITYDGTNWSCNLVLFSSDTVGGTVYVAVYEGNQFKKVIQYNETTHIPVSVECEEGQKVKIFWWDENLVPMSLPAEIEI